MLFAFATSIMLLPLVFISILAQAHPPELGESSKHPLKNPEPPVLPNPPATKSTKQLPAESSADRYVSTRFFCSLELYLLYYLDYCLSRYILALLDL